MNFGVFNLLTKSGEISSVDFSDYKIWSWIIQIGIIVISILLANAIRRKVKFIRNLLLPSSVIGGSIIFILKFIPWVKDVLIDSAFMEALTYHALGLGFVALSMKIARTKKSKNTGIIVNCGIITVNGYLVQAILGGGITLLLAITLMPNLFAAAGYLLPMGFGQGTGQALNMGKIYSELGFDNGPAFGLAIAAIGFFVACIVGVIYMNILKRKGKLKIGEQRDGQIPLDSNIYDVDEAPLNESVDKMTIQIGLVVGTYLLTFLLISILSWFAENYLGNFGINTLKPLFWGFNFLLGTVMAMLVKNVIRGLRKTKIMKHSYVNNFMMDRISGFMFDIMIVAGIAAVDWENLTGMFWVLVIVCALGTIGTFLYTRFVCGILFPKYKYEAFFSIFGMLTGTASTGMILLREIDPDFETPAANNLVFQQVPAIIFGAPILLLVPLAGNAEAFMKSVNGNTAIILLIVAVLFIAYNIILFRTYILALIKRIFKRKSK